MTEHAGRAHTGRTILVVEDEAAIREIVGDVLEAEGYEVVKASNGQEALDRLRHIDRPCLILLDWVMPVMNGGAFLAALRQGDSLATLPVVIVSAWSEQALSVRHLVQGVVKKPVSVNTLLEVVEVYCAPSPPARPS